MMSWNRVVMLAVDRKAGHRISQPVATGRLSTRNAVDKINNELVQSRVTVVTLEFDQVIMVTWSSVMAS